MAGWNRDQFIEAMVSSIAAKQDIEKQLMEVPTDQLSSSALAQMDEAALEAVDSLTFDFPSPSSSDVESLIKAIVFYTGPKSRESLFMRKFSISARFLDGIIYCCSRHTMKKDKVSGRDENGGDENGAAGGGGGGGDVNVVGDGGLASSLSAELAAMVFIKCIRFLLEAPLPIVSRILRDDSLDTVSSEPLESMLSTSNTTETSQAIEESLKKMGMNPTEAQSGTQEQGRLESKTKEGTIVKEEVEEEVWAAELDDDDVPYEGDIPNPDTLASSSIQTNNGLLKQSKFDQGYGGQVYQAKDPLSPDDLQKRLGYIIRLFSSNFMAGISSHCWKKYSLVPDICAIIQHLRPKEAASSSLLLMKPKLADGTTLSLPHWVEEGWVEYTYALRDNVMCDAYDPLALEYLIAQLDQTEEGEEVMSPSRCISFVLLHSLTNSQFSLPFPALRKGLLERLEVFADCIASLTDSLTAIVASGSKEAVEAEVGLDNNTAHGKDGHSTSAASDETSQTQSKALLYEQAKVLLVLVAFTLGVSLDSEGVSSEAKLLTVLPPAATVIRSQVFRNVLKLVGVLGVKPSFKEGSPNPYVLGMQLLVMLIAHSAELAEFAARAPMTATLLETSPATNNATTPLEALLALSLAFSATTQGSLNFNEIAQRKCQCLLDIDQVAEKGRTNYSSQMTHLLSAFAHWNITAVTKLRVYLNSAKGAWFKGFVLTVQQLITEKRVVQKAEQALISETNEGGANDVVNVGNDDDVRDGSKSDRAALKGAEKRNLVRRSDAIKGAKLLLEKSEGGNKTD